MKKMMAVLTLLLARGVWAAEPLTDAQLGARFYYDLGPAEVDVTAYPEAQKAGYAVFAKTCSQCHTLARPINSPIVSRKDWKRYVARMHQRAKVRPAAKLGKEQAAVIVDFLAYDSKVRKVDRKAAFEAAAGEQRALFARVREERSRRQVAGDRLKIQPEAPGSPVKPNP